MQIDQQILNIYIHTYRKSILLQPSVNKLTLMSIAYGKSFFPTFCKKSPMKSSRFVLVL